MPLSMDALFASGRIVDLVLVAVAIEAMVLIAWYARTGRGLAPLDLAGNLIAGASLMLATRAALVQAAWSTVALWLLVALVAHVFDLTRRWRRQSPPRTTS